MTQKRYDANDTEGLSDEQVNERIAKGLTNSFDNNTTKTYRQIFKDNLLTFFNILNMVLAALVILTGYYKDLVFMLVIIANLIIGILQEIVSKKTLDKLALIVVAKATVVRGGKESSISVKELVLDDIMVLKSGDQVCADGIVLNGYLEVNESLITGESDVVVKKDHDTLSSGSFITSGKAYVRVQNVGADSYANKISSDARVSKKRKSELRRSLNKILRIVSFIIIPIGVFLFLRQHFVVGLTLQDNTVKTVAAVIGMIPEGLILLTSIALATSAIMLAYKKTLVQDMFCVETLARVDMLCLDKTGTITWGVMNVEETVLLQDIDEKEILANICNALYDDNSTFNAIKEKYGTLDTYKVKSIVPFSSSRKYSGVCFFEQGTYLMGAYEMLFDDENALVEQYSQQGKRVLVLAHSKNEPVQNEVPEGLIPVALILIADKVREEAREALAFFDAEGVDIKIISGDNPITVKEVALRAGVKNAESYVDATTLQTDEDIYDAVQKYSVFGRVSPFQKKQMICALKAQKHTVAMTGDGVNDVLALKEADCSIAMASGSDAAKNISSLVLLDSNFASMPQIVQEGRRVINNIGRVATLFITKTIYSVLLAVMTMTLLTNGYPFSPLQLTMVSIVTIGFPAFFLALEPNYARIKGSFLKNVLIKSLPGGLSIILILLLVNLISSAYHLDVEVVTAISIILTTAAGIWVVIKVSMPLTTLRKIIIAATVGVFVLCITVLGPFFEIVTLTWQVYAVMGIAIAVMPFLMKLIEWAVTKLINAMDKSKKKVKAFDEFLR
ncbi:MAG: HAD-IC family P-type ATPase [Christensenellaceae bacterium]